MIDAAASLPASTGAAVAAAAGRGISGTGGVQTGARAAVSGLGDRAAAPALGGTYRPIGTVVLRLSLEPDGGGPPAPAGPGDADAEPADPDGATRDTDRAAGDLRQPKETLRTRLDPETLRLFTEVIDPITREALYRVPPTAISEAAEREGEFLARYERMAAFLALEPLPRPSARIHA